MMCNEDLVCEFYGERLGNPINYETMFWGDELDVKDSEHGKSVRRKFQEIIYAGDVRSC